MVSTRSLLSRGEQICQNRVTISMENLILRLELCHIFAQELHVISCSGKYWTDAFLSWLTEELRKKYAWIYVGRRVKSVRKNDHDFRLVIHHQIKLKPHTVSCILCH